MSLSFFHLLLAAAIGLLLWITLHAIVRKLTIQPPERASRIAVDALVVMEWLLAFLVSLMAVAAVSQYLSLPILAIGWTSAISALVLRRKEDLRMLRALTLSVVDGGGSLPDAIERYAGDMRGVFAMRCRHFAACLRRGMNPADAAKSSRVALAVDALVAMEQGPGSERLESTKTKTKTKTNHSTSISQERWSFDDWGSWPINNQLVYLAAIAATIAVLSIFISNFVLPTLETMCDEFFVQKSQAFDLLYLRRGNAMLIGWIVCMLAVVWTLLILLCSLCPSRIMIWITPWFGDWMRTRGRCDGLQALASGLRREQPVADTLSSIARLAPSRWVRWRSATALKRFEGGQPLGKSLSSSGCLNRSESAWIDAASATGHLPNALESIVEDATRQHELKWRIRLAWLVPVALLILGADVCIFAFGLMGTLAALIGSLS